MSEKNHQAPPTIRPEIDLGVMSVPCCMKAPSANQRLRKKLLTRFTKVVLYGFAYKSIIQFWTIFNPPPLFVMPFITITKVVTKALSLSPPKAVMTFMDDLNQIYVLI